jgi:hypothetical protein
MGAKMAAQRDDDHNLKQMLQFFLNFFRHRRILVIGDSVGEYPRLFAIAARAGQTQVISGKNA